MLQMVTCLGYTTKTRHQDIQQRCLFTQHHPRKERTMTAIGFLMCIVGWLLVRLYGSPYESISMFNLYDNIGIFLLFIGFALVNVGVFMKLWEVMP